MATVFITQEPVPNRKGWMPDLSKAADYGAFDYVFPPRYQIHADTDAAVELAESKLANFNPETDFILYPNSGDPAACYVICMVLVAMGHDSVSFLYWNRAKDNTGNRLPNQGFYQPVKVRVYFHDRHSGQ